MAGRSGIQRDESLDEITGRTLKEAQKKRIEQELREAPRRKHSPFPTARKHSPQQQSPGRQRLATPDRRVEDNETVRKRFAASPVHMRPFDSEEGSLTDEKVHDEGMGCYGRALLLILAIPLILMLFTSFPRLVPWLAVK